MGKYDHFLLIEKTVWREWFRYPYFFYVRKGDIFRTVYRDEYVECRDHGRQVQIDDIGDWVEIVLPEEQLRIRFAIF